MRVAQQCSDLRQHGLEARSGLGMEAPGDISGGAHQVLLAFAPAHLLSFLNEGMIGGAHPLQEEVMPIQELAVSLKQVHGYGQHAPQDVGKAVPQLRGKHSASWAAVADQQRQILLTWKSRRSISVLSVMCNA